MTIPRMIGLLIGLTMIGLAVVSARVERARHDRRLQELQIEQARVNERISQQEMDLARLKSPEMIRQRAAELGLLEEAQKSGQKNSGMMPGTPGRR
ncbi:MAG TPA: hypothetical protein PLL20_05130 [Phycisphaerae bacterium]|nr:hypothetical protein [Phycisphaerae bacterium]HRR86564.1 hypothetical protein [Phycisphaerae bacterium]